MPEYHIRSLKTCEFTDATEVLADVLIDCVAGGASVNFMHPLARDKAVTFWHDVGQLLVGKINTPDGQLDT